MVRTNHIAVFLFGFSENNIRSRKETPARTIETMMKIIGNEMYMHPPIFQMLKKKNKEASTKTRGQQHTHQETHNDNRAVIFFLMRKKLL